ncbi:MAG: DUF6263 family protein [bacterium]
MTKKTIILWILLVVFIGSCTLHEKSIILQYKYKKGDVLKYKASTISKGTMTISGLPTKTIPIPPIGMETKTECIFTQKVIGIEERGIANVEISYDSFKQDIKIGKEEIPFPIFGKKEENPFLNFLKGRKFNIKIARDGSILEVNGIEEILDQILAQIPEEIPDEFSRKFKEEFEKNIISAIEENYHRFPVEEMKVGDAWIEEMEHKIPFLGTTHGKYTYTIEEFKQVKGYECVRVGIDITTDFGEKKPEFLSQSNMPPIDVKFKGDAQGKGEMLFAYEEGKLISTDLGMNMKMETGYSSTIGEKEMAMEMKMDFDMQTLVELQ